MRSLYKRKFTPMGAEEPIPVFLKGKKRYPPPSANDSIKPKDKHKPKGRKRYVFIMTKSSVILIASVLLILAIVWFIGGFLVYKSMHDHKTTQPAPIIIHNHTAPMDKVYPIHIDTSEQSHDQISKEEEAFAQAQGVHTKEKGDKSGAAAKPGENAAKAKVSDSQKKFHQLVGLDKKKGTDKEKEAKKAGDASEKAAHKTGDVHTQKSSESQGSAAAAHNAAPLAPGDAHSGASGGHTAPALAGPNDSSASTTSSAPTSSPAPTGRNKPTSTVGAAAALPVHHGILHPPHEPTKLPTRTSTFYNYDVEYYGDSLIRQYQARRHELQEWANQPYNSLEDQRLKIPTYQQLNKEFGEGSAPLNAAHKKKPFVIKPIATLHNYKQALSLAHHYHKMGQQVKILKHYDAKKGVSYSIVDTKRLGKVLL